MADIQNTIREIAVADSGIEALIGVRWYFGHMPQKPVYDLVITRVVDTISYETLGSAAGIEQARLQIDYYTMESRFQCNTGCETIKDLLQKGQRGFHAGTGVFINEINVESGKRDFEDQPIDGSAKWRYRGSQDFLITYRT